MTKGDEAAWKHDKEKQLEDFQRHAHENRTSIENGKSRMREQQRELARSRGGDAATVVAAAVWW